MRGVPPAENVDAYIKAADAPLRAKLKQLRAIVRSEVPDAVEGISYGMPFYKWNGALVGFAAFKTHIGFFPGAVVNRFKRELAGYETAKGSVRFPLDAPLPVALIKTLIKASRAHNQEKARLRKS